MFKPGTRIVALVDLHSVGGTAADLPAGSLATVIDSYVVLDVTRLADIRIVADLHGFITNAISKEWRALDDNEPSSMSIEDILRTPLEVA